ELIIAVGSLIKQGLKIKLKIGGEGPLSNRLERIIDKLNLKNKVYLEGHIPYEHVNEWYHSIDLFVLNSRTEEMPTVILEAMASGLPVVATNVGGVPEAIDNEWLYEPRDLKRLEELIVKVYNMDIDLRKRIGQRNRLKVLKHFNIRTNAKKILKIIDTLN
ncbi:MAG: glycosyltransferase family 4 protein, partial [Thermoprotei archaeon]